MANSAIRGVDDLHAIQVGIELLSKSSNAQELCQRLTQADLMEGMCQGVEIFLLDQRSMLSRLAGYGESHDFGDGEISAWGDSLLAQSIRSRQLVIEETSTRLLNILPVKHNEVTIGAVVFHMNKAAPVGLLNQETVDTLSTLFGLYLAVGVLSQATGGRFTGSATDETIDGMALTTRQVKILYLIAEGMTNAEIAKNVLLSESTVRQETIRIFRVLKVHNRTDAIVKAKANGIISTTPATANQ